MDPSDPHKLPNNRPVSMVIPRGPGDICAPGGAAAAWPAAWLDRSLISIAAANERERLANRRSIVWSGSHAELSGGGLFDEDPRTWGPAGWTAFEAACPPSSIEGAEILIRPHARHTISDVPSCRRLLDSESMRERGIGLVFDPAAMCAPSMLASGRLEDHLRRMYEAIGLLPQGEMGGPPGLAAVIVACPVPSGIPTRATVGDPIGRLVMDLAATHIPTGLPTLVPA